MLVLLFLLGAVLPLLITPGLQFHYDIAPKTITLLTVAVAALMRTKAIPAEFSALVSRRLGRALVRILTLEALWVAIATATSTHPRFSLFGSAWRELGLLTLLPLLAVVLLAGAHFSLHPESVRNFLRIAVCAGIAGSLYGVGQYFDVDPFQPAAIYHAMAGDSLIVRTPGTLGHADYFGWWLSIEFFCGLAVALSDTPVWRILGFTCSGVTALATVLSGTRAALLALLCGGAILVLIPGAGIRRKHLAVVSLLLGALAIFYFSPPGSRVRARVAWSGDEPAGGARPLLWRDSLRMAAAKPLTGYGPETFQAEFGRWQSVPLARLYPDFHHESPHNVALDALTSQGLPGLLLVAAGLLLAGFAASGAVRSGAPAARPLVAGLVASCTAAFFSAAVLAPLLLSLLLLVMLVALSPAETARAISMRRLPLIAVCGLSAVCLAGLAAATGVEEFRLAGFQRNPRIAAYDSMTRVWLPEAAEDIYCSRALMNACQGVNGMVARLECWRGAEQAAARATKTSGDPANAWYNLALFTATQNDVRGTTACLEQAIRITPNWFKPHWAMAKLLMQTGALRGARAEAETAVSLNADHDPAVAQTLRELKERAP